MSSAAARCVFIRAAAVAGIKEGARHAGEKEETRMKKGGVVRGKRAAGTQTDAPLRGDSPLRVDATDATDAALVLGVAAWRARVRAAMAALAAVVDEEPLRGGAPDAPGATGAADAPGATGAPSPFGGARESDEAAEARLRRELGCLGGDEEELSEYSGV